MSSRLPRLALPGIALCLSVSSFIPCAEAAVTAKVIDGSTPLFSGPYADARIGDVILENDDIAVVVSAIGRPTYHDINGGTILDAGSSQDRVDALAQFYPYFDDDWPRQAEYTSLTILHDGSGGGSAVVRVTGHDSIDPGLAIVTDYSLADGSSHLTLTTWVTSIGGGSYVDFELGDAFHWGDCRKFAPGHGFFSTGSTTQPWIAGVASEVSYGYCSPLGDVYGPNGAYWSDMNVTVAQIDPGLGASYVRYLVVGTDMASVATEVHQLTSQADGGPIGGAAIDAYDPAGRIYLQMVTEPDGLVATTLPAGSGWHLSASAAGYLPSDHWLTVVSGGDHNEHFQLDDNEAPPSAIGDTLTVIQRPLLNIPALVRPGDTLDISCMADPATAGWGAELRHGALIAPLQILDATYDASTTWWTVSVRVPSVSLFELYDLRVTANGGLDDTTRKAVRVLTEFKTDWYFAHITDTHLPDHTFSDQGGTPEDSTETVDLREVIKDLNIIHPEFVLITGDLVNEGELEDHIQWRAYTRAQRQLTEFEIPVFLVAGNHDIGGWDNTPPPDGTARRNWWRFFGWKRLDDPPPGAPWRTQNYSFDYGPVHCTALESYINYDGWRSNIYGNESFTSNQMQWLSQDLAGAAGSQTQVLFYHFDFSDQISPSALGVEMVLSGHTHGNRGSITTPPYDLGTAAVCDGGRTYRMVHVSNGTLIPQEPLSAGSSGENLAVAYSPANDGTYDLVSATVTNNHPQRFEHAQLRFNMPKQQANIEVTGGTLDQIDDSGPVVVCYISADILASGSQVVSVRSNPSDVPETDRTHALRLDQNHPNPFNPATELDYYLPSSGPVRLAVFDVQGREVAVLLTGVHPAGKGTVRWDGRDGDGRPVATGVYVARLVAQGETRSRKIILTR
jgi:predicted MPP superfamily phosphohydrolase